MTILGSVVEVDHSITPPPIRPFDRLQLKRKAIAVHDAIVSCTACPLRGKRWVTAPVPFAGPIPADFMVIGEAPGRREDREGMPFVGPAGQLLRAMLEDAGLDASRGFFCNTVSCWPDGTPDEVAVKACRKHLDRQMAVAGTPFVLLTGNVPLVSFRPDLRVGAVAGTAFVRGGRVFMPVHHPAWVLRNRNERERVVEDLLRFADLVKGEVSPATHFGTMCGQAGCGGWVDHYDPEGIPHCARHWGKRWVTPTELERKRRVEMVKKIALAKKRARQRRQGEFDG